MFYWYTLLFTICPAKIWTPNLVKWKAVFRQKSVGLGGGVFSIISLVRNWLFKPAVLFRMGIFVLDIHGMLLNSGAFYTLFFQSKQLVFCFFLR